MLIADGLDLERVAWDQLRHAYGPATDVPGLVQGLRRSDDADDCLEELYASIAHQGSRYTATAATIPFLVDIALDPTAPTRVEVLQLLQFCAVGNVGHQVDWAGQLDRQCDPESHAAWEAVAAAQCRLRPLLDDPDPAVAHAALAVLAWTGDDGPEVQRYLTEALHSDDAVDQSAAWLACVVLGWLPSGVEPPVRVALDPPLMRFGQAVASLRFGGDAAPADAVDALCSIFASETLIDLSSCEFLPAPDLFATAALATAPLHLRAHASRQLLAAIAQGPILGLEPLIAYLRLHLGAPRNGVIRRDTLPADAIEALLELTDALSGWCSETSSSPWILELGDYGLPSSPDQLAVWLELGRPPRP